MYPSSLNHRPLLTHLIPTAFVGASFPRTSMPATVDEDSDVVTLDIEVPGVPKSDISVELADGALTVTARKRLRGSEGTSSLRKTFHIGDDVHGEKAEASLKDGVLSIRLPKRAERKPRQIAIA